MALICILSCGTRLHFWVTVTSIPNYVGYRLFAALHDRASNISAFIYSFNPSLSWSVSPWRCCPNYPTRPARSRQPTGTCSNALTRFRDSWRTAVAAHPPLRAHVRRSAHLLYVLLGFNSIASMLRAISVFKKKRKKKIALNLQ